jgi:ribosomal protein S27E
MDLEERGCGLILKDYSGIRLKGLRKTTKKRTQESKVCGRRFEARTLRIRSRGCNHSSTTFGSNSSRIIK